MLEAVPVVVHDYLPATDCVEDTDNEISCGEMEGCYCAQYNLLCELKWSCFFQTVWQKYELGSKCHQQRCDTHRATVTKVTVIR